MLLMKSVGKHRRVLALRKLNQNRDLQFQHKLLINLLIRFSLSVLIKFEVHKYNKMGSKCSFCSEQTRNGHGSAFPVPRKKSSKNHHQILKGHSQSQHKIVPRLNLSSLASTPLLPSDQQLQGYLQSQNDTISLENQFFLPQFPLIDLDDLQGAVVINSISELRPTAREVREHKETLLRIQHQLHLHLQQLSRRLDKLCQGQLLYGVASKQMLYAHANYKKGLLHDEDELNQTRFNTCGNSRDSPQKKKKGKTQQNREQRVDMTQYSSTQHETPRDREDQYQDKGAYLDQEIIKAAQRYRVRSESQENFNQQLFTDVSQSQWVKYNKLVIKVESISVYQSQLRNKEFAIKVEIPQGSSPQENHYIFTSKTIKLAHSSSRQSQTSSDQVQANETFVLLFKEDAPSKDKMFTISLVSIERNGKIGRQMGAGHSFMIEQFPDCKLKQKEIIVLQSSKEDHQKPQSSRYKFPSLKSKSQAHQGKADLMDQSTKSAKESQLASLSLQFQLIKDEQLQLEEMLFSTEERLMEVQTAIEHLGLLDQNQIGKDLLSSQHQLYNTLSDQSNGAEPLPSYYAQHVSQRELINQSTQRDVIQRLNYESPLHRHVQSNDGLMMMQPSESLWQALQDRGNLMMKDQPDLSSQVFSSNRHDDLNCKFKMSFQRNEFAFEASLDQLEDQDGHLMGSSFQKDKVRDITLVSGKPNLNIDHINHTFDSQSNLKYPVTTRNLEGQKINVLDFSGHSLGSYDQISLRDKRGHIRNSSSQEAGFYIAQHDLKALRNNQPTRMMMVFA